MWKSEPSMQLHGDLQTDTGRVSTPCCRSRAREGGRTETLHSTGSVYPEQHIMNVIVVLVCVCVRMGTSCALSSLAHQCMLQLCTRWLTPFPVS